MSQVASRSSALGGEVASEVCGKPGVAASRRSRRPGATPCRARSHGGRVRPLGSGSGDPQRAAGGGRACGRRRPGSPSAASWSPALGERAPSAARPPRRDAGAGKSDVHASAVHSGRRLAQPVRRHLRASYEVLERSTYDFLIGYSRRTSRRSRRWPSRGRLGRPQDLDLPHPPRREVVRRRAAHRGRRGLHVQPDHQRHLRADQLRQLRRQHHHGHRARRHTRRPHDQEADADHDPPRRPDPARAHLEEGQREGRSPATPTTPRPEPIVGSGPFMLRPRRVKGQFIRLRANPNYWGGAPHIDELVFRVFKNQDSMWPGAEEGRDRLRRRPRPGVVQRAEGSTGHHRSRPSLLRLRRDRR